MNQLHGRRSKEILISDDDSGVVALLEALCANLGYVTRSVSRGDEVLESVAKRPPDLIIMDAIMPGKDGFAMTRELKAIHQYAMIPIIILTGLRSREDRLNGIRSGADDFLTKPIDSEELALRVGNLLRLKEYSDFLADYSTVLESQVDQRITEIHQAHVDTIYRLGVVSEYRDEDTGEHIARVGHFASTIARALGLPDDECDTLRYSAAMHDIGKVAVPDRVLFKRGPLNDEEWDLIKSHAEVGARILDGADSVLMKLGCKIALNHHERWDGTGYPRGLAGEAIPISARIVAIVDQYDALRSERPYKPAFSHEKAFDVIVNGDGRTEPQHFDPDVLAAFRDSADDFRRIHREIADDEATKLVKWRHATYVSALETG